VTITNERHIAGLNDLVETTLDSGYGYREAAGDAKSLESKER
jgi:hypothetical protein